MLTPRLGLIGALVLELHIVGFFDNIQPFGAVFKI